MSPGWASCEFADSLWRVAKPSQRNRAIETAVVETLDNACFVRFLNRFAARGSGDMRHSLFSTVERYAKAKGPISMSFVHDVCHTIDSLRWPGYGADLLVLWTQGRGQPADEVARFESRGEYLQADSLYGIMHKAGALTVFDMLKWGQTRGILGRYDDAAQVYCDISMREPTMATLARAQLVQQIKDTDNKSRIAALQVFRTCCLRHEGADTVEFSQWFSSTCAGFGLYEMEVSSIVLSTATRQRQGERLLQIARQRFGARLFSETIEPARLAYEYLKQEPLRDECALLVYRSFQATGRADSALVWFPRSKSTDVRSKVAAVSLFLNTGMYRQADSLIATIAPSFVRDTLIIRAHFFRKDMDTARELLNKYRHVQYWHGFPSDWWLWKTRLAVFSGDLAATLSCVDSAVFPVSWTGAREMLQHKYAAHIFKTDPDAYATWGSLQWALFTGAPEAVVDSVTVKNLTGTIKELVYVTFAEALIGKQQYVRASALLSRVAAKEATPRVLYYHGEALMLSGKNEEAKALLERLILDYPADVFSSKARIYLLGLEGKLGK